MKIKSRIMIFLGITLCIMTVGFAAFSTSLTITGTADIATTWEVVFSKIEQVSKTNGVAVKSTPTASGTTATFNVGFTSPGDKIVYRITIATQGTLDAVINEIKASEDGSDAIIFELANINQGDILEAGDTTTFDVTIKYDENITSQPNITDNQLTVTINYVQSVGQSITPSVPVIQVERLSAATLRHNTPRSDSAIDFNKTSEEDGTLGLYYTNNNTEDNRTTYYFRGAVENNYVKLGTITRNTCRYNGQDVPYLDLESSSFIYSPTESQCKSTNVCAVDFTGTGSYIYVSGLDASLCPEMGWTSLTSKATYTANVTEDLLWRIIRINEDGSVRMITEEAVGSSAFNTDNDNAYVGYMYGTPGSSTYSATHANNNNSTIKGFLDSWYTSNLSKYSSLISTEAGFCNDRSLYKGTGAGNSYTEYGAYNRLVNLYKPQFKCPNASHDLFTMNTSSKGNKKITKPIGLITADEIAYAGAVGNNGNASYYLNNGTAWWSMSPIGFDGSHAYVWREGAGIFDGGSVYDAFGVRPVINLVSNVQITGGNGTKTNPYVIKVN